MMLAENIGMLSVVSADRLLSRDEAARFEALRDTLPEDWVVDLQADAGMMWVAFVYKGSAPRSGPMFTVCRWDDRVGLFAQWPGDGICSVVAFTELWPILELVLDGIFTATATHPATKSAAGWTDTQH